MERFCENCGAELKENAKFCPKCGYKIPENDEILESNEEQLIKGNAQEESEEMIDSVNDTAIKKGAKRIALKIIAGIVAVALIGAGVGAGYIVKHHKDNKKPEVVEEKPAEKSTGDQSKEEEKEPEVDMEKLLSEVDTDYLLKLCTYLPVYSSPDQISEDDLYEMYYDAMQYCMQYHADLGVEYICEERQIIPDDQFITIESDGTGSFNKTSFDKFCDWTGITRKPEDLSGDGYTYDDSAYYLMPTDAWANEVTCKIVGKGYDKEKEEILINVEKTKDNPMDPSDEAVVTEETVVVVPSDNVLGYQIERIDNGYAEIENVVGESDEWKQGYIDWVNGWEAKSNLATFQLFDLNGDAIPELIAFGDNMSDGAEVATWGVGTVQTIPIDRMEAKYIPGGNVIDNTGGMSEEWYDTIYKIQDGQWVKIGDGTYSVPGPDEPDIPMEDENGNYNFINFKWNGTPMSKEDYQQQVAELIDLDNAVFMDGENNSAVSASEIISQIENY